MSAAGEEQLFVIYCRSCKAKVKVPAGAAGKRATCPTCGTVFRIPANTTATDQTESAAGRHAASAALTLRCPQCAAKLKVPVEVAGRKVKCPKCARTLRVPVTATPPAAPANGDDDVLPITLPEPSPGDRPPASAVPPPPPGHARTCPSCRKQLPAAAKVCVDCGIYIDTGRAIITTQDENLEEIYVFAEKTIRVISWIIWLGVYPVASEAFGLRKPWVVRGIALLTAVVSLAFLAVMWTDAPEQNALRNLMLWTGDPQQADKLLARLDEQLEIDKIDDPEVRAALRAAAEEALQEHLASAGEFHPYQLITHAFLHGGILHLAGNMLFLMVLGARVNALIGNVWTLVLYPALAIIAALAEMASTAHGPPIPMLGASGAVMGLAGMYLVLFPVHKVHMAAWLRWFPVGGLCLSLKLFAVRGFWVVLFYIAFDLIYTVFGLEDETAHWAHLGGFIGGAVIALILLLGRLIDARGGDILSAILGHHARRLIGQPGR